jgi:hypothetical protein
MSNTDGEASNSGGGSSTRRGVLAAIMAGGAYALGWASNAVAAATPAGDVASASDPAEYVYTDKVNFNPRTSDPSSPDDGTMWYNESA